MSAIDELCALGFERYWVNQALELTNHNQEYALEWLLSDEFKLARQQFNEQKKKFKEKQTVGNIARPETKTKNYSDNMGNNNNNNNDNNNPLLINHNKEPSLQEIPNLHSLQNNKHKSQQQEVEIEYNPNAAPSKPQHTISDFKALGIDHLVDDNSDDSDQGNMKNKKIDDDDIDKLLKGPKDMEHAQSAQMIDDDDQPNDKEMQSFLQKLKNQMKNEDSGDWTCQQCGKSVSGKLTKCGFCQALRPGATDWICENCTFVNKQDSESCEMCLADKPSDVKLSKMNGKYDRKKHEEKTWTCASCGYHNANTKCCKMCGYVLGNEVTPNDGGSDNGDVKSKDDGQEDVLLQEAKVQKKPKIDVNANGNGVVHNPDAAKSPSKHVSANSGPQNDDVFGDIMGGWNAEDPRSPPSDDDQQEEQEEEEYEDSPIEEEVGAMDKKRMSNGKAMADAGDDEIQEFGDFDIPVMDNLADNNKHSDREENNGNGYTKTPEKQQPQAPPKPEPSPMQMLQAQYLKDEKSKQENKKIKLKLRVGTVVDIYSSTRQDWTEGIIKEIKGDLICIVYGKHMKWLKKNSRQLRPKPAQVKDAIEKQTQEDAQQNNNNNNAVGDNSGIDLMDMAKGNYGVNNQINNDDYNDPPPPKAAYDLDPDAFQPPPPNDPPPAFAMNGNQDLQAPLQPDHFLTPKKPRNPANVNPAQMESKPDEFDYDVTFTTSVLGLELYPDRDGKNCIVGKCLSRTSKKFVDPSSIIVAVNDMWVAGMSYDMVRDAIKQAAKYPPLKIQFRVKMNNIGKKKNLGMNERGYLKVKVVAGVQLKHRASYCVVQVGNARLSTREVPRDEHPEWQEMLTFKNFRPDKGKKAIVTVYDHSTILKDKKIGTAQYEIPTSFNKLQRDTLELKSTRGKLSGVIILNTIIVHKSNSIRHLRKY